MPFIVCGLNEYAFYNGCHIPKPLIQNQCGRIHLAIERKHLLKIHIGNNAYYKHQQNYQAYFTLAFVLPH